jgi:predicted MFS family arabinose efflux permease
MTTVALSWFVLQTTGSPSQMSLALAMQLAATALFAVPSGILLARIGFWRVLLTADAARSLLVAAVPFCFHLNLLSFPLLLAIVFLTGAFNSAYPAAQQLAQLHIVSENTRLLARSNSIIDAAQRIGSLTGPAVAGVLIAAVGSAQLLYVDALTYVFSFIVVVVLRRIDADTVRPQASAGRKRPGLADGMRSIRSDPMLTWLVIGTLLYGLSVPLLRATLPVLSYQDYGGSSETLGTLLASHGGGAAIAAVLAFVLLGRYAVRTVGQVASLIALAIIWVIVVPLPATALAAALVGVGGLFPILGVCAYSYLSVRTPHERRPHVLAAVTTVEYIAGTATYVIAGPLMEAFGPRAALLVVAVLGALSVLFFRRALRFAGDEEPPRTPADTIAPAAPASSSDFAAQETGETNAR